MREVDEGGGGNRQSCLEERRGGIKKGTWQRTQAASGTKATIVGPEGHGALALDNGQGEGRGSWQRRSGGVKGSPWGRGLGWAHYLSRPEMSKDNIGPAYRLAHTLDAQKSRHGIMTHWKDNSHKPQSTPTHAHTVHMWSKCTHYVHNAQEQ